jgi:2-keto-4-pentenoate hydratase/2-oxohepta-3-ene-1,7-dioic acid hydratase in catechol pathway
MKLVSFEHRGNISWGALVGEHVVDIGAVAPGTPTLRAALESGLVAQLQAGRGVDLAAAPRVPLASVALLPVIPAPDKILCVGINYVAHRVETGRAEAAHPTIFVRFANSQVGHGRPIVRPRVSTMLDYEAELAVVIGRAGRHIPASRALEHVGGYSCYNDASVRDWQRHTTQFTPGKNFVATGGFGPWLVTADEVPDPSRLEVVMRLNGNEMQRATTDLMIFGVAALIEYITTFTELVPGDVIVTGTPGGVGHTRNPPVFMQPGDVAEVEVRGVGVLRNPVAAEE